MSGKNKERKNDLKMLIKTKEFKEAANKILVATEVDKNAANLELIAKENNLFLNVTNKEYYVSVKFPIDSTEEFRAVLDASLFLNLIAGISTETFELKLNTTYLQVIADKSKYKLALIFDNDQLMTLPVIKIEDKAVEMPISNDILTSILNVNSKELLKARKLDVNELQKLYYIDETGCFTFTTGACLNSFQLEKPIKLLLNDRIVKLFKLFDGDVNFSLGHDVLPDGAMRTKVCFETANIYIAALITCDDILINKIQGPCNATKNFIQTAYPIHVVISVSRLASAIARLMLFTKNSIERVNMAFIPATITFVNNEMIISDSQENNEVIMLENDSFIEGSYSMALNLFDLKLVLDSCKGDYITLNCGNHVSVVINRGPISNLIPEVKLSGN